VARGAGGWGDADGAGIRGKVIRNLPPKRRGALPCRSMATVAIQRRHSRSDVTQGASRGEVRADQGESGRE